MPPRAAGAPAVCFSSCFPFLDEIGFVVPPRTIWPPTSPAADVGARALEERALRAAGIVQAMLAGQPLDENHWSVDGPSECLVPAGRPGPFRTGVRWNAAVDRLTRRDRTPLHGLHRISRRVAACGPSSLSATKPPATRWLEPVKAAFRLLADTGFGGERSRGWGRSEAPEFIEGTLPDMILPNTERSEAPPRRPAPEAAPAEAACAEPELRTRSQRPRPTERTPPSRRQRCVRRMPKPPRSKQAPLPTAEPAEPIEPEP